jgi:hypothetical protein
VKLKSLIISIFAGFSVACAAHAGTVTGTLQGPSGLEIKNARLQFDLRQAGLMVGTGSVVPVTASCYTSNDGTVVGLPNPLAMPVASVNLGSGSLPGGVYYVETSFYSVASRGITETLPSPELRIQLSSTGTLTVVPSIPFPANAAGMRVYIGNMSGNETLQGATTSSTAQFVQAGRLITGSNPPAVNSSLCNIAFNDTIIPYSGYNVSLISSGGDAYPGWPQAWQLNGGMNGTVNISEGAPLWDGVTVYPQPIVAQPLNNGPQSISGSLTFGGFNVTGIGAVGVGTTTPSWPIDVENGLINSSAGYLYNGGAGTPGECLVSNGTAFVPQACFVPPALFYQSLASNGIAQPQESAANFSQRFTITDIPGTHSTGVDLAPSGATAGSYTNARMTINEFGQVITASNGPAIPVIQTLQISTGICSTPAASSYATCTFSVNWPAPFADTNYAATCTEGPASGVVVGLRVIAKTSGGITLQIQNGTADGAVSSTLTSTDCLGVHP